MMRKIVLVLSMLLICASISAQRTHCLEAKLYGGRTLPHRIGMESLARTTAGAELNYYFSTVSENFYDKKYRSPQHGFGVSYNYLGYRHVLGSACSLYSFMDFALTDKNFFRLGLRVNAGLSYMSEKYDRLSNPENIAICTNICFYFNLGLNLAFRLPYGLELKLMPQFMHYSNGAVLKPNLGLNQAVLSLALSKELATVDYSPKRGDYQENLSPHEAWLMGTFFTADEYSVGYEGRGGGFPCSTVALGYNYQYAKLGKVGASFDMLYNGNLKYWYFDDERGLVEFYDNFLDIVMFGVSVGHQLVYKRFELMTYLGVHVYGKQLIKSDTIYTRIGGRYYLTNFMFLNLSLHANGFKARYIECGLGFSCRHWNKKSVK